MLSTLAQDENGDLFADAKGLRMIYGAEAVVVLCKNNLLQQPGEDFLLPLRGHRYPALLGKGANASAIRSDMVDALSQVSAVDHVKGCVVTIVKETVNADVSIGTNEAHVTFNVKL